MVAINDGDGWVSVTRPEITDIALGGNETDFPGKFFRELASRDKCIFDLILTSISIISTNTFDISTNTGNIATLTTRTDLIPGRNKIINGNFDIWQRGTSFNLYQYTADRWVNVLLGSSASTVTRQNFTLGQTDVPGNPSHYYRATVTSGGTASSGTVLHQKIESVRTFQGQTVTVSFWAKADATKPVSVEFYQHFGTGGSPSTVVTGIGVTKFTLSSSWAKYTATVSIPSISGKTLGSNNNHYLVFNIWFDAGSDYNSRTNTIGLQSGTFDIAKVQIEEGSTATKFEELPLSTQLNLCQRYYGNNGGAGYILYGNSLGTLVLSSLTLPVSMRTNPAVVVLLDNSSNCTITASSHGTGCVVASGNPVNPSVAAYLDVRVSVDAEL